MALTLDEKIALLKEVGEEIVELDELRDMIQWKINNNKEIYAYDGFEPSGNIHIAQGLLRAINVNKITKAGIKFKFLVADWHAAANHKFGGDLEIHRTAVIHEGLTAFNALTFIGSNGNDVNFILNGGLENGKFHIRDNRQILANISFFESSVLKLSN